MTRFLRVRDGLERSAYARCRSTPVNLDEPASAPDPELERAHRDGLRAMQSSYDARGTVAQPSLLDLKIELARRELRHCRLCPQVCGVDRASGELGFCGVGPEAHVAAQMVDLGELADLVPAFSVFLSGCTMRCIYCRKHELVEHPRSGQVLEAGWFAEAVARGREEGARTLKLLGGTPEPHLAALLECLNALPINLPVMWESAMYISPRGLDLIEGIVDLFIANLRYGNDDCARELSGVDEYVEPAMAAVQRALEFADVAIRHLVLPGHVDCCTGPLAQMLEEVAPEIEMVLLFQYVPFWHALKHPELSRRLNEAEKRHAVEVVSKHKERWSVAPLS